MAHFFKYSENDKKGILCFTHKELQYFKGAINRNHLKKPVVLFDRALVRFFLKYIIDKFLIKISGKYMIGIHWGHYAVDVCTPSWVSFHMAGEGTLKLKEDKLHIPLASRNFLSTDYRPTNGDKHKIWDVIIVAKNTRVKKLDEFLKSVKRIFNKGHKYEVLLVIASNQDESSSRVYVDELFDLYNMIFTEEEKKRVLILKLHPNVGPMGIPKRQLAHFYNLSKVFTLFSQQEGESRVIAEALLSGLPVVVKDDLRGGGRDYLTDKNSVMFSSYENSDEALIRAVESYNELTPDTSELISELSEQKSLDKFVEILGHLVDVSELTNLNDLDRRLPAHYWDSGIAWGEPIGADNDTNDINSLKRLFLFYKYIKNLPHDR